MNWKLSIYLQIFKNSIQEPERICNLIFLQKMVRDLWSQIIIYKLFSNEVCDEQKFWLWLNDTLTNEDILKFIKKSLNELKISKRPSAMATISGEIFKTCHHYANYLVDIRCAFTWKWVLHFENHWSLW